MECEHCSVRANHEMLSNPYMHSLVVYVPRMTLQHTTMLLNRAYASGASVYFICTVFSCTCCVCVHIASNGVALTYWHTITHHKAVCKPVSMCRTLLTPGQWLSTPQPCCDCHEMHRQLCWPCASCHQHAAAAGRGCPTLLPRELGRRGERFLK